jgi:hypothetical protein
MLRLQAFEPEMDWGRFGVRVAQADIPKLGSLLEDLAQDKTKIADMQVCDPDSGCAVLQRDCEGCSLQLLQTLGVLGKSVLWQWMYPWIPVALSVQPVMCAGSLPG